MSDLFSQHVCHIHEDEEYISRRYGQTHSTQKSINAICQPLRKLHDPFFHSAPSLVDQIKKKRKRKEIHQSKSIPWQWYQLLGAALLLGPQPCNNKH
jgi:hypothetical protein